MGLVGRLEDLPIPDIVQIVSLSRGTGVLTLRVPEGRHTLMFRKGLMLSTASPMIPTLAADLESRLNAGPLSRLVDPARPVGVAALERHLITPLDLGKIVFHRVAQVVRALAGMHSGEFEFVARDPSFEELEYDPNAVFKRGGIRPEDILGKRAAGLKALVSVKESLKSASEKTAEAAQTKTNPAPAARVPDRCIVVLENDAATRDAIRNAAAVHGFETVEATSASNVIALLDHDVFFVIVLGLGADADTDVFPLIRDIKKLKANVPVVALDDRSEFRRRHKALDAGADLYMRKPAEGADEERSVFADDLMLFVGRRFAERKPASAGESMHRGFRLLVQLLKEVSNPGDVSQLSLTILQLAADYVDRGVLFARKGKNFVTLGRFGVRANGSTPPFTLLDRVVASRKPFRGSVDDGIAAELESAFGAATVQEAIALPMLCGNDVVGVLYGDNSVSQRPIEDTLGLEVFLSQAGFAFQNSLASGQSFSAKLAAIKLEHA
ncbi:MAG TPA: response regulator [Thermoanaerobaculia bacterium]|nr:response regulator [Thermoanaerobaculia bacterium]